MKIFYRDDAEEDLSKIADFYERLGIGAGLYFLQHFQLEVRDTLATTAGIHRKRCGLHMLRSKRFPVGIFYLMKSSTEVEVFAVLDLRRKPSRITLTLRSRKDA